MTSERNPVRQVLQYKNMHHKKTLNVAELWLSDPCSTTLTFVSQKNTRCINDGPHLRTTAAGQERCRRCTLCISHEERGAPWAEGSTPLGDRRRRGAPGGGRGVYDLRNATTECRNITLCGSSQHSVTAAVRPSARIHLGHRTLGVTFIGPDLQGRGTGVLPSVAPCRCPDAHNPTTDGRFGTVGKRTRTPGCGGSYYKLETLGTAKRIRVYGSGGLQAAVH